ncbi:MAG: hypothetical protein KF889_04870 [Alphaproteobacteria bacterium]|nr:hypothetical protein [Alphaproteobacteria bacterium]MCW5742201.1 hypothetical protein [Alphaproteobacteria bacterium]
MSELGDRCRAGIAQAVGDALHPMEIEALAKKVADRVRERMRMSKILSEPETLLDVINDMVRAEKRAAFEQWKQKALQLEKAKERWTAQNRHVGNETLSIESDLINIERKAGRGDNEGFGRSAETRIEVETNKLLTPFYHAMAEAGFTTMNPVTLWRFHSKDFRRDVVREMARQNGDTRQPPTGNREAERLARVYVTVTELARVRLNQLGAVIDHLPGYITRQSYNQRKIRKASFEQFERDFYESVGEKTFDNYGIGSDPKERTEFVRHLKYRLESGDHGHRTESDLMSAFEGGSANLAKSLSHDRLIEFKNADAWFEFNEKYGMGGIHDAMANLLRSTGRNAGLMDKYGPNPRAGLKADIDRARNRIRERGDTDEAKRLDDAERKFGRYMDILDGTASNPSNITASRIMTVARGWITASKLTGGILSSVTDPFMRARALQWHGINYWETVGKSFWKLATDWIPGGNRADQLAFMNHFGVSADVHISLMNAPLRATDGESLIPGFTQKLAGLMTILNGQRYITRVMLEASNIEIAANLGYRRDVKFADLPEKLRTTMLRHDFDETVWDIARANTFVDDQGRHFVVADALDNLDDAAVRTVMNKPDATEHEVRRFRDNVDSIIRGFNIVEASASMTDPNVYIKYITSGGAGGGRPGDPGYEIVKSIMQFKSFAWMMGSTHMRRELYRGESASVDGILGILASTTFAGLVSMSVKDFFANKSMRDWHDREAAASNMMEALAKGGGLSLIGDIITQDMMKGGQPQIGVLAGPLASSIVQGVGVAQHAVAAATGTGKNNLASETIRLVNGHIPLINVFWARAIWEGLVVHRMMEAASPGFVGRVEQKMMRDFRQERLIDFR